MFVIESCLFVLPEDELGVCVAVDVGVIPIDGDSAVFSENGGFFSLGVDDGASDIPLTGVGPGVAISTRICGF